MREGIVSAYQIYVDPDNKPAERQHVESCSDAVAGGKIVDYLTTRLPKGDRVWGEWGIRRPEAKEFDAARMREETNVPQEAGDFTPTPGRPLVIGGA